MTHLPGPAWTRQLRCCGMLVAAAFVLPVVGWLTYRLTDPFAAETFSPQAWAVADPDGRAGMTRSAMRRLRRGTLEAEVVALLGPGELLTTDELFGVPGQSLPMYGGPAPRDTVRTRSYYLGNWGLRYYDDTFLWVHFGSDGRVIRARIGGG